MGDVSVSFQTVPFGRDKNEAVVHFVIDCEFSSSRWRYLPREISRCQTMDQPASNFLHNPPKEVSQPRKPRQRTTEKPGPTETVAASRSQYVTYS